MQPTLPSGHAAPFRPEQAFRAKLTDGFGTGKGFAGFAAP
jgi:hypothetical protein